MLENLQQALGDRYVIAGEATRGGMATIFRAEDRKHHRTVAIKVLRPNVAVSVAPERFLREIEIAARLIHPHILPLHDSGEANGLLYYVMPYVAGETLRDRLGRDRQMPIPEVIELLEQILDALGYAHAEGVVHRDIKPENIMLKGRNAMLIDFGLAKAISLASKDARRFTLGVALGTPEYMSPEQTVSLPSIDHRTDIYAIGVVAYEMLAGGPPFTDKEPQRVLVAQLRQEPRPVTDFRHLPAHLAELVMRCLKKLPEDRWQSADEMLVFLERHASGGRVSGRHLRLPAPQPDAMVPSAIVERRWPERALIGIAVAAILSLVIAAFVIMMRPMGP